MKLPYHVKLILKSKKPAFGIIAKFKHLASACQFVKTISEQDKTNNYQVIDKRYDTIVYNPETERLSKP